MITRDDLQLICRASVAVARMQLGARAEDVHALTQLIDGYVDVLFAADESEHVPAPPPDDPQSRELKRRVLVLMRAEAVETRKCKDCLLTMQIEGNFGVSKWQAKHRCITCSRKKWVLEVRESNAKKRERVAARPPAEESVARVCSKCHRSEPDAVFVDRPGVPKALCEFCKREWSHERALASHGSRRGPDQPDHAYRGSNGGVWFIDQSSKACRFTAWERERGGDWCMASILEDKDYPTYAKALAALDRFAKTQPKWERIAPPENRRMDSNGDDVR